MVTKSSEETEEYPPANVVEALARVASEIGGIEKLTTEERKARGLSKSKEQGVTFAYRSIDQVTQAAQPLFAKYKIIIAPTLVSWEVKDITVNGNPWTDTMVNYHWDIYGPDGREDLITASTAGLGRDNSDKGFGKAMTNAYKNLILRLLTIGDPAEEIDHDVHPADRLAPAPPVLSPEEQAHEDHVQAVVQQAKDLKKLDNEGTGPYWKGVVEAAGESEDAAAGSAKAILTWIRHDVDAAETLVTDLVRDLKAERDRINETPPPAPTRPKRTVRAKPGSAVEATADAVKEAFPGATEE
jgi:hypothetical protein